jgi:Domain of unknown function (DUF397)
VTGSFTGWRKPARSMNAGDCVEVGGWRTSARSAGGECVEVGTGPAVIGVRDTKLADSPVLTFTAGAWRGFLERVREDG